MAGSDDVTFVFADLSGYTALTEAHGNDGAATVIHRYMDITREELLADARIVERVGDEVVIATASAVTAVHIALSLRARVAGEPRFPALRIGIHRGEVIEKDGHFIGAALNVAARVTARALAGQVVCTEAVVQAAPAPADVTYRPLGRVRLRNLAKPVALYEVCGGHVQSPVFIDPVCRMQVTAESAVRVLTVGDVQRYFCSTTCADAFEAAPGDFTESR
jgi:adenylate cyclase